ncbi:hypothetical protein CFAM422_004410 [Trichoderma lentiforme]|uniref:NACHT domain-containing protein n=1 Tax=Trichoderma lentiforme TaxID=1567552 RepID=A0A9P4XL13_9HYPO|nr:hypothetical protein CFAM422_004410 [Trichoderma lentiforme]
MADPFTIIGVVSSIITFLDVGYKTIRLIRDSGNGTLPEIETSALILKEIQMRCADIKQNGSGAKNASKYEAIIIAEAKKCEQLATKLSKILDTLNKKRNTPLEGGRIAVYYILKKHKIEDLNADLKVIYDGMMKNMGLILQQDCNSLIMSELKSLKESQNELNISRDNDLDNILTEILGYTIKTDAEPTEIERDHLKTCLSSLRETANKERQRFKIIKSLYFPEFQRRWGQIPDAEQRTNTWLFNECETNFVNWLESGNGIYWIQGMAGSGKSTLMKFAAEHPKTQRALKHWALSAEIYHPSFYFWNQGFEMQKSQNGLLQSILYQILRITPSIATQVCPSRLSYERWQINELKATLKLVLEQKNVRAKFCFFIDGLDEYNGDEEDLVQILEFFVGNPNVKICVSSRPRIVLDESFQQRRHTLIIQNFTAKDMRTYVTQKLEPNAKFKKLQTSSPFACSEIITQIASQAKGVWLWVFLITRDLIIEVNRNEGVPTLQKVLHDFPEDLESYFRCIIEKIRPNHKEEMAQIFLLTIEEVQPLPLFVFSLLDNEKSDTDYAIKAQISSLSLKAVQMVDKDWKARIQNRCGDLVIVGYEDHPVFLSHPVDYLHRTVGDFLRDCYHEELTKLAPDFNPLVSLCKMMLFLLKGLPEIRVQEQESITRMIGIVDELLYYAHESEKRDQQAESILVDVLDELDRVNCHHVRSISNHWTHIRDSPTSRGFDEYREGGNCNFLALAVQARLVKYVRGKLQDNPKHLNKGGRPLLDYALRPRRVTPLAMPYHSQRDDSIVDQDMVQLLLEHGADPNQRVYLNNGWTVWELFLVSCYEATQRSKPSSSIKNAWYRASEILISYGASPTHSFNIGPESLSVPLVLERVFGGTKAGNLQKLPQERRQLSHTKGWLSWIPIIGSFSR